MWRIALVFFSPRLPSSWRGLPTLRPRRIPANWRVRRGNVFVSHNCTLNPWTSKLTCHKKVAKEADEA
jgi:hypothetical protein